MANAVMPAAEPTRVGDAAGEVVELAHVAAIPGAPPWLGQMLSCWPGNPPDAGVVYPLPACPASSVLIMRARAFRAWLEPVTPPLRNARRDTGLPVAASLWAIMRA
jgi:hypothetical protein